MLYERMDRLVSVVIPCYHVERYIERCLDGLSEQTYKAFEIIVIDDYSQDNTVKTIQQWQFRKGQPRFSLVELPANVGFSGALTTGLFLAQGEFIAIHDADDYSHPDRFRKQVQFLDEHPLIDVVGTNYLAFEDEDEQQQTPSNWLYYGEEIKQQYALGGHCVSHPTILFRGTVFDRLGGLTRHLKGAEDYEFIAKCIMNNIGVDNLSDILYYYRSHQAQRSREFYS